MAGNAFLPRLGTRGIIEPTGKVKREPKRYATANRKVEHTGPAIETLRSILTPKVVPFSDASVPVRAVAFAKVSTCRFVYGDEREDFTFCGAKATVVAGGALTYCADCAKRRLWDKAKWQAEQDAKRARVCESAGS